MKFLELFEELLLAVCLVILLPITTYWGVNVFHNNPRYAEFVVASTATVEHAQQTAAWERERKRFNMPIYYTAISVGLLAIIIGTLIGMPGIATGLTGGGILNICMALFFRPDNPVINFGVLVVVLCVLITVMVIKKRHRI